MKGNRSSSARSKRRAKLISLTTSIVVLFALLFTAVPVSVGASNGKNGSSPSLKATQKVVLDALKKGDFGVSTAQGSNVVTLKDGLTLPKDVYEGILENDGKAKIIVEVDQAVDVKDPTYKTKAAAAHALAFARLKLLAPDAQKTSDLYYTMNGFHPRSGYCCRRGQRRGTR